jgi:hypothetical protein
MLVSPQIHQFINSDGYHDTQQVSGIARYRDYTYSSYLCRVHTDSLLGRRKRALAGFPGISRKAIVTRSSREK